MTRTPLHSSVPTSPCGDQNTTPSEGHKLENLAQIALPSVIFFVIAVISCGHLASGLDLHLHQPSASSRPSSTFTPILMLGIGTLQFLLLVYSIGFWRDHSKGRRFTLDGIFTFTIMDILLGLSITSSLSNAYWLTIILAGFLYIMSLYSMVLLALGAENESSLGSCFIAQGVISLFSALSGNLILPLALFVACGWTGDALPEVDLRVRPQYIWVLFFVIIVIFTTNAVSLVMASLTTYEFVWWGPMIWTALALFLSNPAPPLPHIAWICIGGQLIGLHIQSRLKAQRTLAEGRCAEPSDPPPRDVD